MVEAISKIVDLTELLRVDWKSLRASGNAAEVPQAIVKLQHAQTAAEATSAYWRIDNTVIVQGALFESAEAAVPCLLSALYECTDFARPRILELLFQIGAGSAHREEILAGNFNLAENCRAAVKLGTSHYFHLLENGTTIESGFCADLIELCAKDDASLTARAKWWFERMIGRSTDASAWKIYSVCLKNLSKQA